MDTEQLYYSYYPHKYLLTLYIMEVSFMKNISKQKTEKAILMTMEFVSDQKIQITNIMKII